MIARRVFPVFAIGMLAGMPTGVVEAPAAKHPAGTVDGIFVRVVKGKGDGSPWSLHGLLNESLKN